MGTNYYARIKPPQEKVEELKKKIDLDHFADINKMVGELYGHRGEYNDGLIIHLGKRSAGWKFLWNPNVKKVYDGYEEDEHGEPHAKWKHEYVYPLTKKGISDFLYRDDVFIFSEYYHPNEPTNDPDEKPSADEFLEMAFNWGQREGWDSKSYHNDRPDEKLYHIRERDLFWRELGFETNYGHDFYSDGLRFSTCIEFS